MSSTMNTSLAKKDISNASKNGEGWTTVQPKWLNKEGKLRDHRVSTAVDQLVPSQSRITQMSYSQRQAAWDKGKKVRVFAQSPEGIRVEIGRPISLPILRAINGTLDRDLNWITNVNAIQTVTFEVLSSSALREILLAVEIGIVCNSRIEAPYLDDDDSLVDYAHILEIARAIDFDLMISQMEFRINKMLYNKDKSHKYRLPIKQVFWVYERMSATPASRNLKKQIVNSAAHSYVDGNLLNTAEVNKLMKDIKAFGDAAQKETDRYTKTKYDARS